MRLEDLQNEILDILRDKWDYQKLIEEFLEKLEILQDSYPLEQVKERIKHYQNLYKERLKDD